MASLESELGVTLLLRSKRGVRPTDACRQLLPAIKRVAAAGESLAEAVRDQLVALVSQGHPLASASEYPLAQFESDSFVETSPGEGTDNARVFARYGIAPDVQCFVSDYRAGMQLVDAGLGVALCNRLLTRELPAGVVALPTRPVVDVAIGIAYARPDAASPAAAKFINLLLARPGVD